ncbi:MAG: ion channel [Dongiaceae bacterium]
MLAAAIAAAILIAIMILLHYEVLRYISLLLPELFGLHPRARVVLVVFGCFAAHTVEVWIFGLAYYLFVNVLQLGAFGGVHSGTLFDYVYFSAVTYTTLGLGDVFPIANVRLIAGVEALTGLMMIGWSASFTYLAMEKFWPLHAERRHRRRRPPV